MAAFPPGWEKLERQVRQSARRARWEHDNPLEACLYRLREEALVSEKKAPKSRTCAKCTTGEVRTRRVAWYTLENAEATKVCTSGEPDDTSRLDSEELCHTCTCGWQWSTPCDDAVEKAAEPQISHQCTQCHCMRERVDLCVKCIIGPEQIVVSKVDEAALRKVKGDAVEIEDEDCPNSCKHDLCTCDDPNEGTEATPEDYPPVLCVKCKLQETIYPDGICMACRDGAGGDYCNEEAANG